MEFIINRSSGVFFSYRGGEKYDPNFTLNVQSNVKFNTEIFIQFLNGKLESFHDTVTCGGRRVFDQTYLCVGYDGVCCVRYVI